MPEPLVQTKYDPGSRKRQSSFSIWIECAHHGNFIVSKESRVDVFFKNLGISVEPQTNDPDFDKKYYIQTDDPEFTNIYFQNENKRVAINHIFTIGFDLVESNGKILKLRKQPCQPEEVLELTELVKPHLQTLSKDINYIPQTLIAGKPYWKIKRYFFYTIPILVGISVFINIFITLDNRFFITNHVKLFYDSLIFFIFALLIYILLSAFFLKGRSNSHKDILYIAFISFFSFPLAIFLSMSNFNCILDKSSATHYSTLVLDKFIRVSKGKHGRTDHYILTLQSWNPNLNNKNIEVTYNEYKKINPHKSSINLQVKNGQFGYEWFTATIP